MECQIQVMQMQKHVRGDLSDGMVCHPGEDSITQFVESGSAGASYAI